MERVSTKHGPRVDDQLKHEVDGLITGSPVEPRVEEFREQEAPADGEPGATSRLDDERLLGLGPDVASARRELSRFLGLHAFPAARDALVEHARTDGATDTVLAALSRLPAGRFETVYDVAEALGLHDEARAPSGRHSGH